MFIDAMSMHQAECLCICLFVKCIYACTSGWVGGWWWWWCVCVHVCVVCKILLPLHLYHLCSVHELQMNKDCACACVCVYMYLVHLCVCLVCVCV